MSYTISPYNNTGKALVEYLEAAIIGTTIVANHVAGDDEEKIEITNIGNNSWRIPPVGNREAQVVTSAALYMLDVTGTIYNMGDIKLSYHCIHIGYSGDPSDTVWNIANPWREELTHHGKQFIPISESEFARNIMDALEKCEEGGGTLHSTIILDIHPSVAGTQVMWAIKALKELGVKHIELRSAENTDIRYDVL